MKHESVSEAEVGCVANELTELPEELHRLKNLTMIELDDNKLSELPEMPSSLAWLQLRGNNLSDLPASFVKMTRLKTLVIANNHFTEIPGVLFQLKNLRSIEPGGNPLTELPDRLMQLPALEKVRIYPNKFSIEEREALREKYGEKIFLGYDTDENSFMQE